MQYTPSSSAPAIMPLAPPNVQVPRVRRRDPGATAPGSVRPRASVRPGFALLAAILSVLLGCLPGVRAATTGNALDRVDFGSTTSESVHNFQPGAAPANLPPGGTGPFSQTYRKPLGDGSGSPAGSQGLTFTLGCDPNRQNYATVKLWGNDSPSQFYFNNVANGYVQDSGGPVVYPNRFYYFTVPVPLALTQGKSSVQLTLFCGGLSQGATGQPVYSVFTHTSPRFEPDSADVVGTAPARAGQITTFNPLTASAAASILQAQRQAVYNSGGYYDQVLSRQIAPGQAGAPPEVVGLDMRTNVASWVSGNPNATPTDWRNFVGTRRDGPGYSIVPDELLSVLQTTYLLPPFRDAGNNVVAGLDHYHDAGVLRRTVAALDGSSYLRAVDGGFGNTDAGYGEWLGVTSTPRVATSRWPGTQTRQGPWGLSLEGVDSQAVGFAILNLLNDPAMPASGGTANPTNFLDYLGQTIDGTLNGGLTLRATVYQQMLFDHINYLKTVTGGTESQNMFGILGLYASQVALQRLQAAFPNSSYNSPVDGLTLAKMVMGIIPEATLGGQNYLYGVYPGDGSPYTNYGLSPGGLGEAHGAISCGFDGGGYGQILPWLAPRFAQLAALDANVNATDRAAFNERANATINAMNRIISPVDNATTSNGTLTANGFVMSEEPFITYRSTKNPNANSSRWNLNAQFIASDPNGPFINPQALRAAYLNTQYSLTPSPGAGAGNGAPGGALNYLRDLPAYEATVRNLIGRDPAALTPLPCEPGQPDFAWADTRSGAVAIVNQGERVYMNVNWRNFETVTNNWNGIVPSQVLRIHDTTASVERAAFVYLPNDNTRVQSDGNLSGASLNSCYVARYGDYLVVMNNGTAVYNAVLPAGYGQAQDLLTKTLYNLGATVPVPVGQSAVFWLAASGTEPGGTGTPTVATAATASPATVTGTSVNLSVLGADDGGEPALTYTWSLAGNPPSPAAFSVNGTNAAKNTTATFATEGTYNFVVVIKDAGGLATSSSVAVTVAQTASSVSITPASLTVPSGGAQSFAATVNDQFGQPMQTPASLTWTLVSGVGALDPVGNYSAPTTGSGGSASVRLTVGALNATAPVTVLPPVGAFGGTSAVGSPSPAGSGTFNNNVYTLQSGSGDVYANSDNFRYVYQPFTGDAVITARVVTITNTSSNVKAGVMFRNSLSASSVNAFMYATPTTAGGVGYGWRATDAGSTNQVVITGVAPAQWVRLTRLGDTFKAENAPDASGAPGAWTQVGAPQAIPMNDTVYVGLALAGINTSQPTATFDNISVTRPARAIFPLDAAIGTNTPGTYSESGSTVTMTGQGGDIWNNADSFQFAYRGIIGNASITARVVSNTATPPSSKVGVHIRDTLAPGSTEVSTLISPAGTLRAGRRYTTNGGSDENTAGGYFPPYWLRLVRSGNSFTSSTSPDGTTWTQLGGVQNITMGRTVQVGLAVASLDGDHATTTVFDNITVTGTPNTPPTVATQPAASVNNLSASLRILGADDDGEANLTYSWYVLGEPPGNVSLSANNTNAAKNTTATFGASGIYYFQVAITDGGGQTVYSNLLQIAAGTITPPLAPGSVTATGYSNAVGVTWDVSGGANGYNVKRSLQSASGFSTIASNVSALSYTDSNVVAGTTYFYRVSAFNSGGEGPDSNVVNGATATSTTVSLTSVAAQDGYIRSSSSGNTAGGSVFATTNPSRLGDDSSNRQLKALLSFDTSAIPDDANITAATLRWKRSSLVGTSPFSVLGTCYADIRGSTAFNNNATLETADFNAAADATQVATMSNPANDNDWSSGVINSTGLGFINKTATTQFRVYFSTATNGNAANNYVNWFTGDDATAANRPVLEVTYATTSAPPGQTLTNRATGGTASASFANPPSEGADKAFDGISTGGLTKWFTNVNGPAGWLQYQFATGTAWAVVRYDLTSANDTAGRDPMDWQLLGSNDGTNWTVLDTRKGETFATRGLTKSYSVTNSVRFGYYRLNVTANAGGSGFGLQLAEMTLMAYDPPAAPASLSATGGSGQETVNWSAVPNAAGYNVKAATSSAGPYSTIANGVGGTSLMYSGLPDGATVYYVISTVGAGGESGDSGVASATTYTALERWRLANFGTTDPTGDAADNADPDGDGMTNAQEFAAGTDPKSANSVLRISRLQASGTDVSISFPSVYGKTYRAEFSDSLQASSWSTVMTSGAPQDALPGTGGVVSVTDTGGATHGKRFYRIVLPAAP